MRQRMIVNEAIMLNLTRKELNPEVENPSANTISVIVSVYNIEDDIGRCIGSIAGQSYGNLEILLIDDGSTDESGRICDEHGARDSRIRVIHQENRGLSGARNTGIEAASGEYIAFVDGDDWIEPAMYEDMLRALQTFRSELAVCNYKQVSGNGIKDSSTEDIAVWEKGEALGYFIREEEAYCIQNAAWNKLYTRELLGDLRFPEGKHFEDIVFTTKLIAKSPRTVYLNRAYYCYVTDRSGSIMNSPAAGRLLSDQFPAYVEKGGFLQSIAEKELWEIHQCFFLKRLLLHYRRLRKERPPGVEALLREIRKIIREQADIRIYDNKPQWKAEKVRLLLFLLSPLLYEGFNRFNEEWRIPHSRRKAFQGKESVVICLSGGLGNQMFQYALYLAYRARGIEVKIDDITEYVHEKKRKPQLSVFGIYYEQASREEICHLTDSYMDLPARIRRKIKGRQTKRIQDDHRFRPELLELTDAYLYGWWQSEKYFQDIAGEVRRAFTFPVKDLSEKNRAYLEAIQNTASVSVHLRRGDYLEEESLYGGICTAAYYEEAMARMMKEVGGCQFFLFTDDPPWARRNVAGENVIIVEGNEGEEAWLDMYLMSRCRHHILANSSFGWWGAWLNENPRKKVFAPSRWLNKAGTEDIYTEKMERI